MMNIRDLYCVIPVAKSRTLMKKSVAKIHSILEKFVFFPIDFHATDFLRSSILQLIKEDILNYLNSFRNHMVSLSGLFVKLNLLFRLEV